MNKIICFIVGIALALISFSASADTFTFKGNGYRSYYTNSQGLPVGDPITSNVDYKIVINVDRDYVTVNVSNDYFKFNILNREVNTDSYKGIYIYCDQDIVFNLYSDPSGNKHIIMRSPKVISVFDI